MTTQKMVIQAGEIAESQNLTPAIIYEYFPLSKVNSVPVNATAFRREMTPNILFIISWKDLHDRTEEARSVVKKLAQIILEQQVASGLTKSEAVGYTNYGACCVTAGHVHWLEFLITTLRLRPCAFGDATQRGNF